MQNKVDLHQLSPKIKKKKSTREENKNKIDVPNSLTLSDEAKLMMFENKVLKTIYRRIQDEDSGEWRQRHNDELLRWEDNIKSDVRDLGFE